MTDQTELNQIMAQTLSLPPDELEQAAYGETSTWDSVAHLLLMNAIEERLGIALSGEDVSGMTDYATIRSILAERYDIDIDTDD